MDLSTPLSVVSLLVAAASLGVAVWATRQADTANAEARRSADAAERSARAAEQANDLALPGHGRGEDGVRWLLEHPTPGLFLLRNVGTATASGVRIPAEVSRRAVDLPDGVVLVPNQAHKFAMVATFGNPMPTEVPVYWDGSDEPVLLPVTPPAGNGGRSSSAR